MNFLVYISEECKRTCSSVSEWQKFNWRNEVSYYVTKSGLQGQSIAYFHLLTTSIERKIQRCWPKECIPSLSRLCKEFWGQKRSKNMKNDQGFLLKGQKKLCCCCTSLVEVGSICIDYWLAGKTIYRRPVLCIGNDRWFSLGVFIDCSIS